MRILTKCINLFIAGLLIYFLIFWYHTIARERALGKIIESLKGESRMAEVLVTDSRKNPLTGEAETTIKFLEYGIDGKGLKPRRFTFSGNLIQFQTLVVRFEDVFVEKRDRLKGKSICLFMKAFVLDNGKTKSFDITKAERTPEGYRVEGVPIAFQNEIWKRFWAYLLDPSERKRLGIKNAQIEAPGSLFRPGTIYTIVIEHDGGIRIDTKPIPQILKGEKIG